MNFFTRLNSLFIILIISTHLLAISGWENPIPVSKIQPGLYGHNPSMASSKNILAITWEEKLKQSTSLHIAFGSDENSLTKKILYNFNGIYNLQPALSVLDDTILVSYSGPDGEIYFLRGKEKGRFWSLPYRLTYTLAISIEPKFYYDDGNKKIYLFFIEQNAGNYQLKYTDSSDLGATWEPIKTIFDSEKTGMAIFFPSIFIKDQKFYVIYQGRLNQSENIRTRDNIYLAVIDEQSKKIIKNIRIVKSDKNIQYTPIVQDLNNNIIWREAENNLWNLYIGTLKNEEDLIPFKINTENKNCYNHSVLFSKDSGYIKIFWSMLTEDKAQIYSRRYYFENNQMGNEILISKTKNNAYFPHATLFNNIEFLIWQEEFNNKQSAIFLQKQDTHCSAPIIIRPKENVWYTTNNIKVQWQAPKDASGINGYGYTLNPREKPDTIIQNLPAETTSVLLNNVLAEGNNYFYLCAFDQAGNVSPIVLRRIQLDTSGPLIQNITSPTHPKEQFVTNHSALVYLEAQDNYQAIKGYAYQIDYGREETFTTKKVMSTIPRLKLTLQNGISYLKVAAVDMSGHWGPVALYPFYVSSKKPEVMALSTTNKMKETQIALLTEKTQPDNEKNRLEVMTPATTSQTTEKKILTENPPQPITNIIPDILIKKETEKEITTPFVQTQKKEVQITMQTEKRIPEPLPHEKKEKTPLPTEQPSIGNNLENYLLKNYSIVSKPIYQSRTRDIIGRPENVRIQKFSINNFSLKRVQFKVYVRTISQDPDTLPPEIIYIWSPILNHCNIASEAPYVPSYIITRSQLFLDVDKLFRYFYVDIVLLEDQDFLIIYTEKNRIMSSSIIKFNNNFNPELLPESLKWIIYE